MLVSPEYRSICPTGIAMLSLSYSLALALTHTVGWVGLKVGLKDEKLAAEKIVALLLSRIWLVTNEGQKENQRE